MENLKDIISYEKKIYCDYMFSSTYRYWISFLKKEPTRRIWQYQKVLRKCEYYHHIKEEKGGLINNLFYLYYIIRLNSLGEKLGIEIGIHAFDKGLLIYHYGSIVVNCASRIGKNCHLHGDNCIGNDGTGKNNDCPVIGDNVMIGVGAKVIGKVRIANNIKIAAGAVVVTSFDEEGITIGGIPARKLK
jgi:hypothetical protein